MRWSLVDPELISGLAIITLMKVIKGNAVQFLTYEDKRQ